MHRFLKPIVLSSLVLSVGCNVTVTTDIDGDGVEDGRDACPGTRRGEPIDPRGCSMLDDDGDGVFNDMDFCDTPAGQEVNRRGCPAMDTDGDGVDDEGDVCRNTRAGDPVNNVGCSTLDDDGDGVNNDMDQCVSAPGDIVDGTGCLAAETVGTLDGQWLINGLEANAATCDAAGIADVRFNVDAVDGSDAGSWVIPCANGIFDSRTAIDEPTIDFNVAYTSFWEALDAAGVAIAATEPLALQLNNPPTHATVATPDFIVLSANELTIPLAWETDFTSGVFGTCAEAMVDRDITVMVYLSGVASPFASFIDAACGEQIVIREDDYPGFGPGSYELDVAATAGDGTKWGATCAYEYGGGIAEATACNINVVP